MKPMTQIIQRKTWKATVTLMVLGALASIFTTSAGKPPKGPSDIPLCVTIEPVGTLESDGLGPYCDGQNGVRAVFTADQGRFSFDTGTRRKANVDLGVGLIQGNNRIHFLLSRDQQDPHVNDPGYDDAVWHVLHLEDLPVGSSIPVGILFFISPNKGAEWVVGFGDYPMATDVNAWPCNDASPAIVTRIDANTWTLEGGTADDHCLYHGYGDYPGRIAFPFKMTLRRK